MNLSSLKFEWQKFFSVFLACVFLITGVVTPRTLAAAQEILNLPAPGSQVSLSPVFIPPLLKGIKVYPNDPLRLDFILDKGDIDNTHQNLESDTNRLIKYFLASLTIPEKDLWVNLSPYEKDRIVPEAFGETEMGRDLLAQDYILKQITASVIYPEGEVGKKFWDKVYAEALIRYGTTDIPVDTFNKVWIVPEKATVYENENAVFVVDTKLKVMLESDYLTREMENSRTTLGGRQEDLFFENVIDPAMPHEREASAIDQGIAKNVLREVVIPILEQEVNAGKNFASLRQVYHSLILATWYKRKIKESILGQAYVDRQKTSGVNITHKNEKEKIWEQYVQAFKKGAFNFIKEEYDAAALMTIPRKYFSGGADFMRTSFVLEDVFLSNGTVHDHSTKNLLRVTIDCAMKFGTEQEMIRREAYRVFIQNTQRLMQGGGGVKALMQESQENGFDYNNLLAFSMYAYLFVKQLAVTQHPLSHPLRLVLAQDPRPSSLAVHDAVVRGILAAKQDTNTSIELIDIGVFTTPMTQFMIRDYEDEWGKGADGGVMISGSHNPLEENVVKFFASSANKENEAGEGALLGLNKMRTLIDDFKSVTASEVSFNQLRDKIEQITQDPSPSLTEEDFNSVREGYLSFIRSLFREKGLESLVGHNIDIDSNGGSAAGRYRQEDLGHAAWVLSQLGMQVKEVNQELGKPKHLIEPSLNSRGMVDMSLMLRQQKHPLGVVFDYDADRGTVEFLERTSGANPQTTVALNVAMALSWMDTYHLADDKNVVIVVHDMLSQRIDAVAALFSRPGRNVQVRRVAAGEVNVVAAMQEERRKGNFVPLGIEGTSNGIILMESTSRDGIINAVLAGLAIFSKEIYETWSRTLAAAGLHVAEQTFVGLIKSLPEPERITELGRLAALPGDRGSLHLRLQDEFVNLWATNTELRRRYKAYQVMSYDGTHGNPFLTGEGKDGWGIVFINSDGVQDFFELRHLMVGSSSAGELRCLIDAHNQDAFNFLKDILVDTYQRIFKEKEAGIIFDDSLEVSQQDLENKDKRQGKRYYFLKRFPWDWSGKPTDEGIERNKDLIEKVARKRLYWFQDEDPNPVVWTKDGERKVTIEYLREDTPNHDLQYVLEELVKNAFDAYASAGYEGHISLRFKKLEDNYIIEIVDKAVGVNFSVSDSTDNVGWYVRSNTVAATHYEKEGGMGLGILWSQAIIQSHGGRLEFLTADGEGFKTKVRIVMPLKAIRMHVSALDDFEATTEVDEAMAYNAQSVVAPGGIDLNVNNVNLMITGEAMVKDFSFDPAILKQMQEASGVTPVIMGVSPVNNLADFLGVSQPINPQTSFVNTL